VRVRIPADVEAPDKILYGLTARQVAILAAAAVLAYTVYRVLGPHLPWPVLLACLTPVAAVAALLALGRRDGLSMDAWVLAGIRHTRAPTRLTPTGPPPPAPGWAPQPVLTGRGEPTGGRGVGVLRLPVDAITDAGVVDTGDGRTVALVAATTVNLTLRTPEEQAALLQGYGRWLNSLTAPVQIVVSAARVDLTAHADRITDTLTTHPTPADPTPADPAPVDPAPVDPAPVDPAPAGPALTDPALINPALAAAARGYADFLTQLAATRDPLWRTVTIAHTSPGGGSPGPARRVTRRGRSASTPTPTSISTSTSTSGSAGVERARRVRVRGEVRRRAEHTAAALSALGARAAVLDGGRVTGLLATAADPYAPTRATWSRARPGAVVTGPGRAGTLARTLEVDARPEESAGTGDGPAGGVVGGVLSAVGVVGPSAVQVGPGHVRVGGGYAATLVVTGYPGEVGAAWLDPLLAWPARLDVAVHIDPLAPPVAAARLRRQRARWESVRRADAEAGRVRDPDAQAAAQDAADLAERIARGEARLFRVGVYLTVHAQTAEELEAAVADVRAVAAGVLLDTHPATWRQLQGWTSTLPLGCDTVGMRRVMDTDALAAAFPLACPDLPAPLPGEPGAGGGMLYGVNPDSSGVVWWDRWAQDNHNSVVLARSGAGKSYFVKLEVLRCLIDGVHVAVLDPEHEYLRLAEAVGGTTVALGGDGVRLNPLDIPPGDTRPDALTRRALFLHTLVAVLLGEQPPPGERAALDAALIAAYDQAGIHTDPTTWARPAPLLRDLHQVLAAQGSDSAQTLAARLAPWVTGSHRALFDGPTTTVPTGRLVVWSTRHLPDELRPAGMLLALDTIWRDVDTPAVRTPHPPRRLVVVDEAWTLLQTTHGAAFLYRLAKAARKRRAGLTVVTQDVTDLLGSDLGRAVLSNAATQILLRQAPQAADAVAEAYGLTTGETRLLLTAPRGQGLLLSGTHRVAFHALASPTEHHLCTDDLDLSPDPTHQGPTP
jgi:hypothetical protein